MHVPTKYYGVHNSPVQKGLWPLKILVGVHNEADSLQDPMAAMLCREQIGLEDQADAHRVASRRCGVDRGW